MAKVGIAVGVIGSTTRAALWLGLSALTLGAAAIVSRQAFAQQPANDEVTVLSADVLADLVGPIALYPDDLVAIVLPASTYPLQVVQASRFLDERAKNPNLKPSEEWDDSVLALLNYPDVVKLLNDDLDWTWRLGDAVIDQRADVLDAIQGFRDRAYAAGNLRSDDRQVVARDDGAIAIKPADPEVIYVPYYEPERVVVYQSAPVYHYYPIAYPVYYYPYPVGYSFHTGYFWGLTSAFAIGWHSHLLHVHHHDYWGHPYYGRSYYTPYYYRRDANVSVSRGSYVWEPRYRRGGQAFTRNDGRRYSDTRPGQPNVSSREGPRNGAQQGSYRNGTGPGQQRGQPFDRNAAATRDRADGSGGTYRSSNGSDGSGGSTGDARGVPQRNGATNGAAPRGRQTGQPFPNRGEGQSYRTTPQNNAPQVRRESAPERSQRVAPRSEAPAARSPGQYRSGGGMSQAQRQTQPRESAAPAARVAPPSAQRSPSGEPRVFGGASNRAYRDSERGDAQPRVQRESVEAAREAPRQEAQRSDGGGGRSAPSARGGSDEGRGGGGGRNTGQPFRSGRATDR